MTNTETMRAEAKAEINAFANYLMNVAIPGGTAARKAITLRIRNLKRYKSESAAIKLEMYTSLLDGFDG